MLTTIRIPVALLGGIMLAAALFLTLAELVGVQFEAARVVATPIIEFTPQVKDTPIENKRDPKVARPAPPPAPVTRGVSRTTTGTGVTAPTRRIEPTVAIRGKGLSLGTDRDVLPLVRVPPDYPPRAAASNIEGWVRVRFSITPTGSVRDAVVVASEPGTIFDEAALRAIARWRYNPRIENGAAVERVGLETVIRFELKD